MLGDSLLRLDLSENELSHMEDDALSGLERLLLLNISRNDLNRFNSDVFKGTEVAWFLVNQLTKGGQRTACKFILHS